MPVMSQCYSIIIDQGISAPGHGKEVVDGLNAVDKQYIYQFMYKVQLTGSVIFDSQIKMHTGTKNKCKLSSGIQRSSGRIAPLKWCH